MKCPLAWCMGVHTRGGIERFVRRVQRYVTLKEPFMIDACGSQMYLYVPFFSVTVQLNVHFAPTLVFLFRPGPGRWEWRMLAWSWTTTRYLPYSSPASRSRAISRASTRSREASQDAGSGVVSVSCITTPSQVEERSRAERG